jgi:hypothetical protein
MSSVFDKFRNKDGTANFLNIMQEYQKVRQNPSEIGDLLLKAGRINQEQYNNIKTMNNPRQIGEYLLNNNKDFKKMYNGR